MEQNEITKIIKGQSTWKSVELIKVIKEKSKKQVNIKFCYIGGYELLRDGTKTTTCKSLKSIQDLLDEWSIEYDAAIKDPLALAVSVRANWSACWDDGGGSAWIEL
jgi:hypothetical protein